ncbi:50S ribosomal protein L32 [Candidatus Hodgkinia cicadicola]|nr:50S ribosomal protein L32 [Candidatus Hodgkinia cicadicola]
MFWHSLAAARFSSCRLGGLGLWGWMFGLSFSWRLLLINRWAHCEDRRRGLRL